MEKLIAQLLRLYVPNSAVSPEDLARHILGQATAPITLEALDGMTRAIAIPFAKSGDSEEAGHWSRLCAAASALQVEHGFPPPAVSVDGINAYYLWISLEAPVPAVEARQFARLLHEACFPGIDLHADAGSLPPQLPPCPVAGADKWAAFIHPGMGASFADEPGLDIAPPPAAQAAFLEGLESVSLAQFRQALLALQPARPAARPAPAGASPSAAGSSDGLLLRDATLEDIVRHLHAKNIEPTFRHLVPGKR